MPPGEVTTWRMVSPPAASSRQAAFGGAPTPVCSSRSSSVPIRRQPNSRSSIDSRYATRSCCSEPVRELVGPCSPVGLLVVITSSSVAAEPSCRYGALAHSPRNVGVSMPVRAPPLAWPEPLPRVPTSCKAPNALSVNAGPEWHDAQPIESNSALPRVAAADSEPSGARWGLMPKSPSERT